MAESSGKVKCVESVWRQDGRWGGRHQCKREAGHGPDAKYCAQHAEKHADGATVTWYRVDAWSVYSCAITLVEVLKETKTMLLVKEPTKASREPKVSSSYHYFPTREEAIHFYRERVGLLRAKADDFARKVDAL